MNNVTNAGLRDAIELGNLEGVRSRMGSDINADFYGSTYLHWAASYGRVLPQEGSPEKQQQKRDGISMPLLDDPRIV